MSKTIEEMVKDALPKKVNFPWVAFLRPVINYKNNQFTESEKVSLLPLIGSHATKDKIDYYLGKRGWKIVKFEIPDTKEFAEIKAHVSRLAGAADSRVQDLETEKSALEAKIKAYEEKFQNEQRRTGKKDN